MNKPTVRCIHIGGFLTEGVATTIIPIDHPNDKLNDRLCVTSTVEKIEALGFETKNTNYVITEKV